MCEIILFGLDSFITIYIFSPKTHDISDPFDIKTRINSSFKGHDHVENSTEIRYNFTIASMETH